MQLPNKKVMQIEPTFPKKLESTLQQHQGATDFSLKSKLLIRLQWAIYLIFDAIIKYLKKQK